jgi:hypothetical protein
MIASIVFTGHMIDLPDRQVARFPPDLEHDVRQAIRERIAEAVQDSEGRPIAYASGARGGDIIFHEECRAMGLETVMVLPFPPDDFEEASVAGVPTGNWPGRFRCLWHSTPVEDREVMNLPKGDQSYAACNLRLLERARQSGRFHLIALWDGKGGDGPGGTADMVKTVRAARGKAVIIDPGKLRR